ncbi:MAG: putative zinc-binding protein [Dehalococcoidia bacterium]
MRRRTRVERKARWKLFIYTCFGGCATGVSASKACIRLWEENPSDVKIACLPAAILPQKRQEMVKSSEKRLLIDGCAMKCGYKLFEREGMPVDRYIELTSCLGMKKVKALPTPDVELEVYDIIRNETLRLLRE